ncbi:serine/threonine-protein kinase [Nocardia sp. NPDC004068]|uniref:serine/threonine-protein kinase n=1 Tax=Nocardia sp. NPDC004068 TaxID=3364303 RepID=UPI0036C395A0
MALSPGTVIGGYLIQSVLGAGGMGTVYLAKHPSLPRMDALKVLSPHLSADAEFRGRFEREANLAAGLDHPNIVSVYNRGEENGQLWIAMQYVRGTDAAAVLARQPATMTPMRALRIVTEVGKGLDYAHRKGLLHRDVKPANFLLSEGEEEERVLLTDFGVAKSSEDATELTQTGSFVATIAYAAPEQLSGERLDHRADVYSLACSFYKLLTGQNPYPATQPAMVMMGHLHQPPPRATAVNPALPSAIDVVFQRALAKNPADRFNSCREFTDAATGALVRGVAPTAEPTWPRYGLAPESGSATAFHPRATEASLAALTPAKPRRRRFALLAAAAVVVAVVAGGGIWMWRGSGSPETPNTTTTALAPLDQARKDNPAFAGTTITAVDLTGADAYNNNSVKVYLNPSDQTTFLKHLGFNYNTSYARNGDEPSPREIGKNDRFDFSHTVSTGYMLLIRSDANAGNGGFSGLPSDISNSRATIIVVDDPATVDAFRNWNADSEKAMLDKLVPLLHSRVK